MVSCSSLEGREGTGKVAGELWALPQQGYKAGRSTSGGTQGIRAFLTMVGPGCRGEMLLCEDKQGLRGFPEPACKARLKE